MKGSAIFKATVCLSGWGAAAWLLLSKPLEPIALPASKERGTPMPPLSTGNPIESTFLEWSADPALAGALVGFCVLDESGKTVFTSALAGNALCPASALKTVTTAAALEIMGPDFTFWTRFTSGWGLISPDGILEGDLFLEGRGDPTLSIDDLDAMVASLVRSHSRQVKPQRAD
jgi:D-alanyl-D-alanine carboxypeptidase/D-alanyl-D-alanine-endopeptidase (penicillin-binding protein 4)